MEKFELQTHWRNVLGLLWNVWSRNNRNSLMFKVYFTLWIKVYCRFHVLIPSIQPHPLTTRNVTLHCNVGFFYKTKTFFIQTNKQKQAKNLTTPQLYRYTCHFTHKGFCKMTELWNQNRQMHGWGEVVDRRSTLLKVPVLSKARFERIPLKVTVE